MSDLVERLRANAVLTEHDHDKDVLREAADRIAQLEAALRSIEQNSLSVCAITIARAALGEERT